MKNLWKKLFSIRNKNDMHSNMAKIIILGWFLPLVLLTAVILLILSFTLNRAGRDTAQASAQKADRILKMRL